MKLEGNFLTIQEAISYGESFLKQHNPESPRIDAEFLLQDLLNWSRAQLIMNFTHILEKAIQEKYLKALDRRALGEPVAYILGYKDFYKHRFFVNSNVLIPRPETEELVELALKKWETEQKKGNVATRPLIVDLGSGSGCLGLSIKKAIPASDLVSLDISSEALDVTRKNAEALGLEENKNFFTFHQPAEEVQLFKTRLYETLERTDIDILVANPPYIDSEDTDIEPNVKKFEPHGALFASNKGLAFIFQWIDLYGALLGENGFLFIEIGHKQSFQVLNYTRNTGLFNKVSIIKDYSQRERFLLAERLERQ